MSHSQRFDPAQMVGQDVFIVLAKTDGSKGRLHERIAAVMYSEDAAKGYIADLRKHYQNHEKMDAFSPMMQPNDLQVVDADGNHCEFYTYSKHGIEG